MCIEWYHPPAYTFNQYYLSLFFELSILPDDLLKFNFNTRLAGVAAYPASADGKIIASYEVIYVLAKSGQKQ
jgi:hypothetical protein